MLPFYIIETIVNKIIETENDKSKKRLLLTMKDLSIQACYTIFYNGMYMLLKNRILLTVLIGTVLE